MSAAKSDTVQTSAEEPLYDVSGEYRVDARGPGSGRACFA